MNLSSIVLLIHLPAYVMPLGEAGGDGNTVSEPVQGDTMVFHVTK